MKKRSVFSGFFIGLLFFLQLAGILYCGCTEARFFCWAPYDEISIYTIDAEQNGKKLSDSEISKRYGISAKGRQNRSIYNIISIVRQFENTYGKHSGTNVTISFTINGYREGQWSWPDDEL